MSLGPVRYRSYTILEEPVPMPGTWIGFYHDDYDGAPDSGDNRCGFADSIEDAQCQIDALEAVASEACGSALNGGGLSATKSVEVVRYLQQRVRVQTVLVPYSIFSGPVNSIAEVTSLQAELS